ncbi:MAG: hypothetical protein HFI70_01245 [Lachnospiraceae bacterium]|nr:hypothetical protein [Lachnospiraceae bacterium]
MRHDKLWLPPFICGLLLAGCASRTENTEKSEWKENENKNRMKIVEKIMRVSADGTRKVFSEMFNKEED